ncbi:MAG: radical SAM protein [Deltaproteobacteria bacterium]|nr:radical SAM protein [Deltaproteobacteria bacterium]
MTVRPAATKDSENCNGGGTTYCGAQTAPLTTGLPRTIQSICPECLKVIEAHEYVDDNRVMVRKECPEHGVFNDLVFSDARIFEQMEGWHYGDGRGFENPHVKGATQCPSSCGLCNMHTTHTSLANVDITGRCNLSCSVCFADSNTSPYQPEFEEVLGMLRNLRERRPAPAEAVQFMGGEPTIHPRFIEIIKAARDLGFKHIQTATNGIKFADPAFAMAAAEAGLQYLYLQMDGVDDEVFKKIRGRALLKTKLAAIESCRKAGLRIIFVPTVIKGVNDQQLGPLVKLAFENLDVLTGISVQPIVFAGRYAEEERLSKRFTLADMIHEVGKQTGITRPYEDWFPISAVTPFVKLGSAITGHELTNHTCHHHCVMGTLLFVDENRNAVPAPRFLDLHGLLNEVDELSKKTKKRWFKVFSSIKALGLARKYFNAAAAPAGLTFQKFLKTLDGFSDKKYSWNQEHKGHTYKTFFIIGMHFMDNYNYSVERVKRCAVHYSAPNGLIYPFCTYNAGHTFRNKVEGAYAERARKAAVAAEGE